LGSAYFQLLDYGRALTQLSNQVDNYPDEQPYFDHALLLKGMVEENLSKWKAAHQSYERLLSRESAYDLWPEGLYRFGGLALRSADYGEALTAFSRIIVEFPDSEYTEESVFFVGECHFFLGRYSEAERSFRSVLDGEPTAEQWQTSLYRLALILSELGRNQQALDACNELETTFPESRYNVELTRLKADLLFDLKLYTKSYNAYERSLTTTSDPKELQVIHYNMGLSAFLVGDLSRCLEPFEKALQGRPEIVEQSLFRLAAAQAELGLQPQAVRRFEEYRRRFPSSEKREEAGRILAALYLERGAKEKAVQLYTELITRYPDSEHQDEYLFRRGSSYLHDGTHAAALKDFFALSERWRSSPYRAESLYNIGYIYSKRGEYSRGAPYFQEVLDSNPTRELAGRSLLAAGVCAFNAGQYDTAVQWFRKNTGTVATGTASSAGSGASAWIGESWFYLGRTHYKLEQLEEASSTFGRASELLAGTAQGEEALFWKGLSEFRLDRLAQAKETFLSLADRYPRGQRVAESYYRAGICASQFDNYQESIDYFDLALRAAGSQKTEYRDQLKQEIYYRKGLSYLQAGKRERALETYQIMSSEYPDSALASEAYFKVAEEDFRSGRYSNAVNGFVLVRDRFPASPAATTAQYWAGLSASRNGDRSTALEYLIGFLEDEGNGGASGGLSELAMQEIRTILAEIRDSGQAEEGTVFEKFYRRVDRSPSLDGTFKNRVRLEYARYIYSSNADGAMAILQTIRSENSAWADTPGDPLASEVNYLIGEYYRRNGELDRAADIFSGIISANSGQPGADSQLGIARILEARGRTTEAAEEYLKVHFLYPDHLEVAAEGLYRAGLLYWQADDRDRAEQLFQRLASEYPDSPWLEKLPPTR
jgi:TolA-binding protein